MNGAMQVSFTPPVNNGGSPITEYYAMAFTGGNPTGIFATGAGSPITITGLTNGVAYTAEVYAINSAGAGPYSVASNVVIPSTVPSFPTNVVATAGTGEVSTAFTPGFNGGSAVLYYTATASTGQTAQGSSSPIVISGLPGGVAVTVSITATNVNGTGPSSVASNPVTPVTLPGAPTGVVGTKGNAQVSVAFVPPASNGGEAITSYTVTASNGGATGSGAASPIIVSPLTNGTAYTFTVTATNGVGTGPASAPSAAVTPSTVPGAPGTPTAVGGNASAVVTFTAPSSNGGAAITGYTVTSSPGSITASGSASPITVPGLTNGTAYTFTVKASNSNGAGAASAASNSVTPTAGAAGYDGSLSINSSGVLVNGAGIAIQLRGTNASGLNDQTIIPTSYNQFSPYGNGNGGMPSDPNFAWFASEKYNAVRFPINVQAFLGQSYELLTGSTNATAGWGGTSYAADIYGKYKYYLLQSILLCRANGLYVILDAHECAPQFTLGGVTASLAAIDQSPFMDAYSCSLYWGSSTQSLPAWLATNLGSAAFNTANGFNGGAAGAYYDSTKGGTSGFQDVIFELFNEPYFGNQNQVLSLTCIAGTHGNPAWKATNGGNAITVTNGQTPPNAPGASSLGATLAGEHWVMLYGGTCSAFYQQGVYSNSRGIPTGFVNPGNTGLPSVLDQSWTVYGYQQAVTAIRALGATNVCLVNGSGFAASQSILPYYMPVDTLSPPQIGTGWHQYESGSSGYPATLDPGSGTSTAMNYGIANANGTGGLGYAVPVIITEIATTSGTSNTQPDPYYTYMTGKIDTNSLHITDFAGNNPAAYGASGPVPYCENIYQNHITITGGIATGSLEPTLTVTATSGTILPGMAITSGGEGGYGSPYVLPYGTNGTSGTGGTGTYALSFNQTVSAGTSIQLSSPTAFRGQGETYTNWTFNHT